MFVICNLQEISEKQIGSTKVVEVQRWINRGSVNATLVEEEVVYMDYEEQRFVKCSCHFLDNWGLVCQHVLRIMEVYGAFDHDFCHSIPGMSIKDRWTRSFKKSYSTIGELAGKALEASNYGERYQRIFDLMVGVGTKICYNEDAYKCFMGKFVEVAKEAKIDLACALVEIVPSRLECSSSVGDGEVFVATNFKQHKTSSKSNIRLMSQVETHHLIWKQQRKKEMAMMQGDGSSS
ncbi:hypothetical protein LIER_32500 [Lithospermum erythrorhizon]|uniref:Protein FAR1-RELATED SEQUENCE n=1 Tax=Lithospermum erythrorhizon TaxID=34254 RepID=A0AAV3RVC2_LITER